jgi:hypothetical protein
MRTLKFIFVCYHRTRCLGFVCVSIIIIVILTVAVIWSVGAIQIISDCHASHTKKSLKMYCEPNCIGN